MRKTDASCFLSRAAIGQTAASRSFASGKTAQAASLCTPCLFARHAWTACTRCWQSTCTQTNRDLSHNNITQLPPYVFYASSLLYPRFLFVPRLAEHTPGTEIRCLFDGARPKQKLQRQQDHGDPTRACLHACSRRRVCFHAHTRKRNS